jgi:hypothetical protein
MTAGELVNRVGTREGRSSPARRLRPPPQTGATFALLPPERQHALVALGLGSRAPLRLLHDFAAPRRPRVRCPRLSSTQGNSRLFIFQRLHHRSVIAHRFIRTNSRHLWPNWSLIALRTSGGGATPSLNAEPIQRIVWHGAAQGPICGRYQQRRHGDQVRCLSLRNDQFYEYYLSVLTAATFRPRLTIGSPMARRDGEQYLLGFYSDLAH